VLDEADKMLEMGFEPQIRELLARLERAADSSSAESPPPRLRTQNVLLSATFPKKLRAIAHSLQLLAERPATVVVDPVSGASEAREGVPMSGAGEARPGAHEARQGVPRSGADEARQASSARQRVPISTEDEEEKADEADEAAPEPGVWGHEAALVGTFAAAISPSITQLVQVCAEHKKPRKLMRFLDKVAAEDKAAMRRNASAVLIFCTKIKTVQFVHTFLKERQGLRTAGALHGGMQQRDRERVLSDFKAGKLKMLVATDVAGRGIDVKGLPYVVNYDFPASLKVYAHRIGRTGRQDQPGTAFSFFTRNFSPMAHDLRELLLACKQTVDPYLTELVDAPPGGSSERPAPEADGADNAPGAAPGDDGDGADADEPAAAQGEAGVGEGHGGESRNAARRKKRRLHRKAGAAAAAGAVAAHDVHA
jgi:superfamily II DNA/RNA helicase